MINIRSQAAIMFRNEYMGAHDIHNMNTYNAYHNYSNKSVVLRKTTPGENDRAILDIQKDQSLKNPIAKENHNQHLPLSISSIPPLLETEITMSVEKDLHIIVTTVKNKNTDKIIRQIPSEEIIERLKYLKKYDKQHTSHKENDESNIIA